MDVLRFKGTSLDETRRYTEFLQRSAASLYGDRDALETVTACPACNTHLPKLDVAFSVFQVPYHRCPSCGHGFVGVRPTASAFARHFAGSDDHAAIYVDTAAGEQRITQIVIPKLDWALDLFADHVGGRPKSGIDVGAGGGHFVAAARRAGIAFEGFELANQSRRYAKDAFDLDLLSSNFLQEPPRPVEMVTFWGLLEYTPEPRRFMEAARKWLAPKQGMLVVEVPRFEAIGTAAQVFNPDGVARHMDPTSHINCFSDSGLFSALVDTGFKPVAAWYFGMDAYELLMQFALKCGDESLVSQLAESIPMLQAAFDGGRLCDDIIVAAVPA